MSLTLHKYQALGNDYIVVDPEYFDKTLDSHDISMICDRHFGVGADGVIIGPIFEDGVIKIKILNSDGSEAEKSGNGICIFSRYMFDHRGVSDNLSIHTISDVVEIGIATDHSNIRIGKYDHELLHFLGNNAKAIDAVLSKYEVFYISVGNPHCVIITDHISSYLAQDTGPIVELFDIFPNRVNVQFVKIIDDQNIQIEIWERGSGYTLSSGSSACAAVCASYTQGYVKPSNVNVHMRGGVVQVSIKDGDVYLTGRAKKIMTAELDSNFFENK